MKKNGGFFAMIIIAVVFGLSMISCGGTDGTLEIVNETGAPLYASWYLTSDWDGTEDQLTTLLKANEKLLNEGATGTWTIAGDSVITWYWNIESGASKDKWNSGPATITADTVTTVTAKASDGK